MANVTDWTAQARANVAAALADLERLVLEHGQDEVPPLQFDDHLVESLSYKLSNLGHASRLALVYARDALQVAQRTHQPEHAHENP
jgi:hypothetical protein